MMTDAPSLDAALDRYDKALTQLEPSELADSPPVSEQILEALLARDAVQVALDEAKTVFSEALLRLNHLDDRLKPQLEAHFKLWQQPRLSKQDIRHRRELYQTIANWRDLKHPPNTAWWWHFDPPALTPWLERRCTWSDRFDWLWTFLTLFFLTIAVTFILNTLNRVLAGGIDAQGLFAVVLQTALTLAGGVAALTQQGRHTLETFLTRWRIPRHHWQELSAGVTLLLMLIVIGIHNQYLPRLAADLHQDGIAHYQAGRLDSALANYQQAIALRPDYAEAHYNLGILYEDLQKPDQAIAQYELVVQSEPPADPASQQRLIFLRAHNNLGRLYLLKEEPQAAWVPLERGKSLVDADVVQISPDFRYESYNLLKNLGWARLQQKSYVDAANYLQQAIELDSDRAPAYCLQAQVLAAQEQDAQAAWERCLQYASLSNPDEAHWIGMAYEYLANIPAPSGETP
ncbi:MAG: hypothetical protein Kow00121_10500 [Elainellaceae cyanobacterium]